MIENNNIITEKDKESMRRMNQNSLRQTFAAACINGNLAWIKYMLNESKELNGIIDINDENNHGFIHACRKAHIHIIDYLLLSYKIDEALLNQGFKNACQEQQIEVIEYLIKIESIKKLYPYNIINNIDGLYYASVHSRPKVAYHIINKLLMLVKKKDNTYDLKLVIEQQDNLLDILENSLEQAVSNDNLELSEYIILHTPLNSVEKINIPLQHKEFIEKIIDRKKLYIELNKNLENKKSIKKIKM